MISTKLIRYIHTNSFLWQATNKSLLAKLRKKTGYTFSNCKKALELHQNDLEKVCLIDNNYIIIIVIIILKLHLKQILIILFAQFTL